MLSVVIPVYNEEKSIEKIYKKLADEVKSPFEVIFVDDGSSDKSWQIIKSLPAKGIKFSKNFGKEAAICAGLAECTHEYAVVIDADGQHPPAVISEMLEKCKNGADIVECIKKNRQKENFINRFFANMFYKILKSFSKIDLKNTSDFRMLSKKAIEAWKELPEKETFFRAMSSWLGFKKEIVYFDVQDRLDGSKSRYGFFKLCKLGINSITSFTALPLHFVTFSGVAFSIFSIALFIQTLARKLAGQAVEGFTTVILVLLIIGSILMISLGTIGLYIAKIYDEIKGRPRYIIQEKSF